MKSDMHDYYIENMTCPKCGGDFHSERYEARIKERDEAISKYRSIELANREMTRNDHVVFGDLLQLRTILISFVNAWETPNGDEMFREIYRDAKAALDSRVEDEK